MTEQDLVQAPTNHLLAEDTVLQLFRIAAMMLDDEQDAVSVVEESVANVQTDPCADGPAAYTEARALLLDNAVRRMAQTAPEAFAVPAAEAENATCLQTDDLELSGLSGNQLETLIAGAGPEGMRRWLGHLAPAARAIFVLRAVAGQDGEQTARSLRQSGVSGAQAWQRDEVSTTYRQALCSLASGLMSSQSVLTPA